MPGNKSVQANVRLRVKILDKERSFNINMTLELYNKLLIALIADVDVTYDGDAISRTELDSHANMPVVGRYEYVTSNTG